MSNPEIAWAAGLFEGEGCISVISAGEYNGNRTRPWVKLAVQMTDPDVLEKFCRIVGAGGVSLHHRANRPNRKDCWSWQAGSRLDVERILTAFMPWFGERRAKKAQEALELISATKIVKPCGYCGEEFEAYRAYQRFCCREHGLRSWQENSKLSGHRQQYQRGYYRANRDAALERARQQRERKK